MLGNPVEVARAMRTAKSDAPVTAPTSARGINGAADHGQRRQQQRDGHPGEAAHGATGDENRARVSVTAAK